MCSSTDRSHLSLNDKNQARQVKRLALSKVAGSIFSQSTTSTTWPQKTTICTPLLPRAGTSYQSRPQKLYPWPMPIVLASCSHAIKNSISVDTSANLLYALAPPWPPPPELLQLLLEGAGAVRQPVAARMIEPGHLRGLVPRGAPPADGGGSSEFDSGNPVGPRRHGTCWEVRCTCWSLLGNWTVNAVASQSLLKLHRVSSTAPTHLNKKLSLSLASQAFKCPPGPGRFGCILQAEKWKHENINKPNTSLLHHKAMTT